MKFKFKAFNCLLATRYFDVHISEGDVRRSYNNFLLVESPASVVCHNHRLVVSIHYMKMKF